MTDLLRKRSVGSNETLDELGAGAGGGGDVAGVVAAEGETGLERSDALLRRAVVLPRAEIRVAEALIGRADAAQIELGHVLLAQRQEISGEKIGMKLDRLGGAVKPRQPRLIATLQLVDVTE